MRLPQPGQPSWGRKAHPRPGLRPEQVRSVQELFVERSSQGLAVKQSVWPWTCGILERRSAHVHRAQPQAAAPPGSPRDALMPSPRHSRRGSASADFARARRVF